MSRDDYTDGVEIYYDGDPDPELPSLDWILENFTEDSDRTDDLEPAVPEAARLAKVRGDDAEQNVKLKRHLAYGSFVAVGVQLLLANVAFFIYGFFNSWDVEPQVMISWLGATVIETLGVVLIIARHLFPDSRAE